MSTPYEPVLRHTWGPGDVVCKDCHYEIINTPCDKEWCACACHDSPTAVHDVVIENAWFEPPGKPEGIETWEVTIPVGGGNWGTPPYEETSQKSHKKSRVKDFIAKWEVPFGIATVALYVVAVILVFVVFPDVSNTWLAVLILVSGLTASLSALASMLKTKE